jgi:hypothetical protein
MIDCSMEGCKETVSEILCPEVAAHWVIFRACRCGAYQATDPRRGTGKSCTCTAPEGYPVPMSYWPHLDWWILGGVEEVILCPRHKGEIARLIVYLQTHDSSMDAGGQGRIDPGNRH